MVESECRWCGAAIAWDGSVKAWRSLADRGWKCGDFGSWHSATDERRQGLPVDDAQVSQRVEGAT